MADVEAIFTAVLTIGVGLFVIDLVPLQEPMVCPGDYHNKSTCPEVFFAQSFHVAREKFTSAATKAGAEVKRAVIASRDGVEYTLDTAFLRGKNSKRLLVHISGSDGIGGFTGSAIQTKLLSEWNTSRGEGPSVLFVHALNPYGMANFRTTNENNVELHRNYLLKEEWNALTTSHTSNTSYDSVMSPLFLPKAPRVIDRYTFFYHFGKVFLKQGLREFRRSLEGGQWHNPEGLFYGGREEQRSLTALREVLTSYAASGVEKFVFLDVHTDSGSTGKETIIVSSVDDKTLAQNIFKASVQLRGNGGTYEMARGFIRPTDVLGNKTGSLVIEQAFATTNYIFMVRAAILENAASRHAEGTFVHETMKQWMRDAYFPQTIHYKTTVLTKGIDTFNHAMDYLST
ncbi:Protein of unknown function (DUF2817), putative [Trypanosoma equiperdum]|uniref:DUF2817 domain-containing protein n=4 Tax=Trypanozoon TaxID=39700 RepID=Q586Z8_TRYB2|nr:hypothetical protein, conserved [Trypanosoma brucei gambiense DAL972]XP_845549.1 hypothetical protein, conserved [Trypanosoma brucei brucei TREU927]AAX79279.1 hypothetical protein, conserved [Trypanosoma brucei]RHW72109.1 hypothetical protein DPX39_060047200 [Trypanosoma brucei equiperdum]SCU65322.1 Protein of unknown function (DUF2817), putative [Trypanosoma equiperdum]AAZ11990.1 hypothetical protein, conserved [Trypanosoma brucei brucei TREU927]CBH11935.1 hypothetical protein, conserved |eukprot:XP_011774220.1 hypothetical protein, conserved [Trypanosoma brucei gambiense DAL972]